LAYSFAKYESIVILSVFRLFGNVQKIILARRYVFFTLMFLAIPYCAVAQDFTDAIRAYLHRFVETLNANAGIVVGIVDEHGNHIVSCGKLDNGSNQEVNGDTLFETGSVTKTFTGLLLQDMVERGEMKLDDPVAKYLPESIKMPTYHGKEITLLQLATHTSGLPREPDNLDPTRAENPCSDFTVEKLYAFLASYKLTRDPGMQFEYSNPGIALLAHAIALKAGKDFESLVVDRICRPLAMDSTRITLTPELKARLATGHTPPGYAVSNFDFGALAPAAGLYSTVNDMLKYVSANLGLTSSSLTPLMVGTHEVHFSHGTPDANFGLVWAISSDPLGAKTIWHNGATAGYLAFAGFDKTRHRGVVVLCNSRGVNEILSLGKFLLGCEWQPDHRPTEAKISSQIYDSYTGQYQRASESPCDASGMPSVLRYFLGLHKAIIYIAAASCLTVLAILLLRTNRWRKRSIILCYGVVVGGVLIVLIGFSPRQTVDATSEAGIGVRREGDRLFAQVTGSRSWPVEVLLPPISGELLPESETHFFESLSGTPVAFTKNASGKVACLTAHYRGNAFTFEKTSDQPPHAPEPPRRPVVVKLETKLLDACVGRYEFAPSAASPTGVKLAIWREGDHLVGQFWGENLTPGAIDIYPESETKFFLMIDGTQLTFIKNERAEVTDLIHHVAGLSDFEGKKVKSD
jgi:serine-type D-Ala-D-Ala carboxypeptidase/endopeptidase